MSPDLDAECPGYYAGIGMIVLGDKVPRRGNRLTRALGRSALAAMGWRFEVHLPDLSKFVIIVAPHTSAWDFVVGILASLALDLRASWLGKHALFRWSKCVRVIRRFSTWWERPKDD